MPRIVTTLLLLFPCCLLFAQPECPDGELSIIVTVQTDVYGGETAWEIVGSSDTIYASVDINTYANNSLYQTQVCVPEDECITFRIYDEFGDGIFEPGYYLVTLDGDTIASGYDFGFSESVNFNCQPGQVCETAEPVTEGSYITTYDNHWYSFTPDSVGIYIITTCGLESCDTRIWVYDTCEGNGLDEDNKGTIFFDDDQGGCDSLANVNAFLDAGVTYLIRIGDDQDACGDSLMWEIVYQGPVVGCTDPNSCNYNPLATIDDGSCLPQGHPECPEGPDLLVRQDVLQFSMYLDSIYAVDQCLVQEGCLKGYGKRYILRFSTRIENIGEKDYYIGEPDPDNTQFTWDNCHNHFHYDGYAEYILFDENGQRTPIGFKNGFCVIDLGCNGGSAQYGCNNMGISAGCFDEYWAELQCQWIDITDMADGTYTFVTRVNWDNAPDALGQVEKDTLNNWAQVCLTIDRSGGQLNYNLEFDCAPYVDCEGTPYGNAQIDCNGICGGGSIMGDLNTNGSQEMVDAQAYVTRILGNDIEPLPCNDLNADDRISVYDAALLSSCLNYGASHVHTGEGIHDHCNFPAGIFNSLDTVGLTILDFNQEESYIDIGMLNPSAHINAYQFRMNGISILSVENLVNEEYYPIAPMASIADAVVIGLSYEDSLIQKSTEFQPLCRIHYLDITAETICIEEIVDIVNADYELVVTRIVDGCMEVQSSGLNGVVNNMNVDVQPNPFNDQTLLRFPNPSSKKFRLELMDVNGKLLRTYRNIRQSEILIDREDLADGIYFFRLSGEAGHAVGRLNIHR